MSDDVVSGVPALIDALVAKSQAKLADRTVTDGYGVVGNAGDYLMVGIDNAELLDASASAESSQDMSTASLRHIREEFGSVTCLALSWNGDGSNAGQKAARDAAYATVAGVAQLIRDDPSLELAFDGTFPFFVCTFGSSTRLLQNQDNSGAESAVVFTIAFATKV